MWFVIWGLPGRGFELWAWGQGIGALGLRFLKRSLVASFRFRHNHTRRGLFSFPNFFRRCSVVFEPLDCSIRLLLYFLKLVKDEVTLRLLKILWPLDA